ncbi:unnamed protein product [Rotaria magnacalcarata]|uniref:Uncharacterized protein n=1 Tax=Rotaria magnacalcarata TaxID=392030 RepID=A0A819LXT4_9BILA|nr:unnamed protein product [Rotaria magnacalcarata]
MKSKDIQKVVKSKYGNDDGPMKIYRDLAGVVSLKTIKLWIKMINNTGSINLSSPPGRLRITRTDRNLSDPMVGFILLGWPSNSPDLCPFDYSLWKKLGQVMYWKYVTTETTSIEEIKQSVKKFEKENI